LVESQSGKQVFSPEFRLLKNRDFLILSPIPLIKEEEIYLIEKDQAEVNFPLKLAFSKVNELSTVSNEVIFVDEDQLKFPLVLRHWQKGDSFYPFGLEGKSKKLSKLFKDEKLSLIEKENVWLLCSDNQIVWVIGIRPDERFKTDLSTRKILKIQLE
jgi:tRNA(Ile)-lysidine synthase